MSEKCCQEIYRDWSRSRCRRNGTKEHDGKWYCGTHHPDAVDARHKKSMAKFDGRMAELNAKFAKQARDAKRAELFPELVNALSELYAVTPSTAPGIGLEGAKERHAAACKLAVDVLSKSKALL